MDPKMDQCFGVADKRISLHMNDLLRVHFPAVAEPLAADTAARLFQCLLILEAGYLGGASLLESTHQCPLLWNDSWSAVVGCDGPVNRAMLLFCQLEHATLGYIHRTVLDADIYEGMFRCKYFCCRILDAVNM